MTKNPFLNALTGLLYIVMVASVLYYAPGYVRMVDSVIIPIMFLSLFVFSASCMGYIFLYQPLQFFLEGEKKKSIDLFIKTLFAFAISATVLILVTLYLNARVV